MTHLSLFITLLSYTSRTSHSKSSKPQVNFILRLALFVRIMITIAATGEGDLPLKVRERDNSVTHVAHQDRVILREETFLVSQNVIEKRSSVLDRSDKSEDVFTIEVDRISTMEHCLRALHKTTTPTFQNVPIDEMWNIAVRSSSGRVSVCSRAAPLVHTGQLRHGRDSFVRMV